MKTMAPVWILLCFYFSAAEEQKNATVGDNVTLTCRAPNNNFIVVKWSRADLESGYVLLHRDWRDEPDEQHPSFKNRVDLQDRQTKDGDLSLILKNVTINDTGTYECRVFMKETRLWKSISTIYLSVAPPGPTGGTPEGRGKEDGGKEDGGEEDGGKKDRRSVGLIVGLSVPAVLLLLAAVVGFWIYRKHQEQQIQDLDSPPAQAQTQVSLSSFQLNSEPPAAAVPLLSVVTEHRDRNDLKADSIQQHPTNTPHSTLTVEEEPLHHPQENSRTASGGSDITWL